MVFHQLYTDLLTKIWIQENLHQAQDWTFNSVRYFNKILERAKIMWLSVDVYEKARKVIEG